MALSVGVFGLGYVGAVTGACLADSGHQVIGVDPDLRKVELINSGSTPVMEEGLAELIERVVAEGSLVATSDAEEAFGRLDVAVISVGTPSRPNGSIDLSHISNVSSQIGEGLHHNAKWIVVAVRSTVLPGTTSEIVIPALENASGLKAGEDFGVAYCPEFLREGSSVADYYAPPKIVIGATDQRTTQTVASLFEGIDAPRTITSLETAELVKYVDNSWHALKVGFANEVGRFAKEVGVDSHDLMDIFVQDRKLNISEMYLRPGFAFGGSCLPKDLRAMCYEARARDVSLPILEAVLPSNRRHVERALELIVGFPGRRVGVLGLSFKAGTDDLRDSPMVEVVERLIGKGYDLRIYDPDVGLAAVYGANREYLLSQIPHVSSLLVDSMEDLVAHADTLVIGTTNPKFERILDMRVGEQQIVDLVRVRREAIAEDGYHGIGW